MSTECGIIGDYIYRKKPIGKGTFSKVYKGLNTETDVVVAIKIICINEVNGDIAKRVRDEARLLSTLNHPGIIKLYEFLEKEDKLFLILEYCSQGDLYKAAIEGGKTVSENAACSYLQQIADALSYLNSKQITHRDLKPHNILLTEQGLIKLTDFNCARKMTPSNLSRTLCGSPYYMAPEIIERGIMTMKSDLWSVGVILYELMYGHTPFHDSENILELIGNLRKKEIEYSDTVASHECNDLIGKLLQQDPELRMTWDEFFTHPWLKKKVAMVKKIPRKHLKKESPETLLASSTAVVKGSIDFMYSLFSSTPRKD